MILLSIRGRGFKRATDRLNRIRSGDRVAYRVLNDLKRVLPKYWNIQSKLHYNVRQSMGLQNTGQWGKSLVVNVTKRGRTVTLTAHNKPIYAVRGIGKLMYGGMKIKLRTPSMRLPSTRIRRPGLRIPRPYGLKVYEYSQYLKRNVGSSKGAYVRDIDARVKHGTHRGIRNRQRYVKLRKDIFDFSYNYIKYTLRRRLRNRIRGVMV